MNKRTVVCKYCGATWKAPWDCPPDAACKECAVGFITTDICSNCGKVFFRHERVKDGRCLKCRKEGKT